MDEELVKWLDAGNWRNVSFVEYLKVEAERTNIPVYITGRCFSDQWAAFGMTQYLDWWLGIANGREQCFTEITNGPQLYVCIQRYVDLVVIEYDEDAIPVLEKSDRSVLNAVVDMTQDGSVKDLDGHPVILKAKACRKRWGLDMEDDGTQ